MKTVGTKLDESEYQIFEFCCDKSGLTKSEQLRDLIKNFVNNKPNDEPLEINYDDLEPENKRSEGIIKRISYDHSKTWHDVKPDLELMNVTVES